MNRLLAATGLVALTLVGACSDQPTAPPSLKSEDIRLRGTAYVTSGTVVVKPSAMNGWIFAPESAVGGTGGLVNGPLGQPLGTGSLELSVSSSSQGYILALPGAFGGSRLAQMQLAYSTYRQSADAGNNLAIALQFNLDHDVLALNDALTPAPPGGPIAGADGIEDFQGRLVYEPYRTSPGGGVTQGTWQAWDADQGLWWRTTSLAVRNTLPLPGDCLLANPCTIAQILLKWPNAGVSAAFDAILLKAGSGWNSFTGNVDQLVIAVNGVTTTFDFEPETQCTTVCYANTATGNDAFGGDSPGSAKKTIQAAVNQVTAAGTVYVAAGTYNEDVVVSKSGIQLLGSGVDVSIIDGPKGNTALTTLEIPASSPGVLVDGFTVTRTGNNVADWNGANGTLNNQGVAIYGAGTTLRNSKVTGNRNGVFLYGAANVNIRNNVIDFNRTGIHLVNDVTGLVAQNNFITDNWTMGVLFRDESTPNTTGAVTITNNDISGNWYSQVEARSSFSAPSLDVTANWLGTAAPLVFVGPAAAGTSASGEPGYAAQIPVAYGGGAIPPASSPTIAYNGLNATNPVDYIPFQCFGTDTSPAIGFQPTGLLSNGAGVCDTQGPITTVTPPSPAPINTAISLSVSVSDLTTGNSPLQSYTWVRDLGTPATVTFGTSAVTQSFSITIAADVAADVDNICVYGTDVFGNIGPTVCVLAVWYDPSAGFVTGGGWINSPAGAYSAAPSLTGRANFGFVSKYQKGKTIPTGNTEFQFNAASLSFKSTSMEWLVVSGARAQFKGAGTINGAGSYTFMLTAIDGQTSGGGGTDKFRIRIWATSGGLVYDNMLNAPDTSDPTTVLGGGNIMIHK